MRCFDEFLTMSTPEMFGLKCIRCCSRQKVTVCASSEFRNLCKHVWPNCWSKNCWNSTEYVSDSCSTCTLFILYRCSSPSRWEQSIVDPFVFLFMRFLAQVNNNSIWFKFCYSFHHQSNHIHLKLFYPEGHFESPTT